MRGRDKFAKFKPFINLLVVLYRLFPRKIREHFFVKLRKKAGKIAMVKRYALVKTLTKSCGENVAVFTDVYLQNMQELELGNNVSIQPMTYIEAAGGIKIGNDISIAEGASIFSVNHRFDDLNVPIKDQGIASLPVVIKDNVWIGSKATILGGVTVESGTIVAAGAVVTRDTLRNSTVAGVPAKIIKQRDLSGGAGK